MAKIRVRVGTAEAEVEADQDKLREAIELVPELVAKLPKNTAPASNSSSPQTGAVLEPSGAKEGQPEVPVIALEKGDSLAEIIGKFFDTGWGRERRKLSDVREALQVYGLNYPKQSVAVALLRLAKATKIRRFKADDGEFVYTSSGFSQPGLSSVAQTELA